MKRIFIILVLQAFSSAAVMYAQKPEDADMLRNADFSRHNSYKRKVTYGFSANPSKLTLCNPFYHLLSSSMWVYQKFVSPQLAGECPYSPSCSAYSRQLVRDYGLVKGVICSADRLMRCNRIVMKDYHHHDLHNDKIRESTDRYSLKK